MTELSRRKLLAASAWAVPVVAVTVATPLVAASIEPLGYALEVDSPIISSGAATPVRVTFPASALPIQAGSTSLVYRRIDGTGVIVSGPFTSGWSYSWPPGNVVTFSPPANPSLTGNVFTLTMTGPSVWEVELTAPEGSITRQITVLSPPV